MFINQLLEVMYEAAEKAHASKKEIKSAIVRGAMKAALDKMPNKTLQDAKTKKRGMRAVNGKENPGDKYKEASLGELDVFGATGIDGDGYALEEGSCGYQEGGEVKCGACEKPCPKCKTKECSCKAKTMQDALKLDGILK